MLASLTLLELHDIAPSLPVCIQQLGIDSQYGIALRLFPQMINSINQLLVFARCD